ncbi:1823_t:CDS:10 [Diversispora eburnea]|uniref:1823_t:CDS:1 n=1 Tax=Diversispora eburnea TaxID=1213867 RepID=A0A9N8V932_9GLOM|nr:1823_t:CDS:10 [Diversispora eburnea]
MATSNTMNFGPEWMRRFPKTQTSDNNRSTSPTLSSNVPTNSSSILGSTNNNTNTSVNTGTNTHSWSFVAAANSSNTTTNRSLHHEASEKSDVPGAGDSELNPFKYSKEKMLKLYKPVGLPLEFERHEYVTSEEPLQPMALINLSEHEHKLLTGTSVNSDLTRRMVSNATGGGTVTVNERVSERERVPFSPRGEKHVGTGLTSPRTERFTGITGVLSGRTSPRSSRPPRISGSANSLSADDPVWNGVTRHAVGTFDSNGVFRIPGSNNTDDESIDKSKKDDFEHNNKTEQEFEKKNPADHSDEETYYNLQEKLVNQKIEYQNENINEIDINSKSTYMEGSHSSLREEQNTIEQDGQQEKEREQDCDDEPDKVKNLDQQLLEQHELLQQLELHEKEMEEEDDDVLKEAFSYTNVVGNTPPMSPTKSTKYSSTHSIIGTSNAFGDTSSGASSLFSGSVITSDTRKQAPEQQKWLYRDPSGPFSSQEMNDWYKGGFFVLSLLVKRVEDPTFEPLGALIRKTGDDERPFSASITRPSLTIAMPNNSSRVINDPFPRTWATPNSPSTAQLFLDHQQRFNPFGGTASVPTTPFDRYQFGGVFGRNDVTSGWNDLGTANNTWGQTEGYSSNAGNLSPRLQAPNSPPPLFNNTASFNVSPPPTYLEQQRALTSQIERQQFLMLQQRQQLSQSAYPDGFIRQQHQSHQNFVGISGPVSAPITNAPNSPFIDSLTRSTGVSQSDDLGYFNLRKEINLGMQQSAIIEPLQNQNRTNERQYDITGGQISEPSFDNKILSGVTESITKPILGDDEVFSKKIEENLINQEKVESKLKSEESAPQLTQNEGTLRSKPSLREIQAEEELSNSAWGNNTFTIPAPWGKDEDHSSQKTLSIREIQELETKQSTERHIPERHISERKFSTSSTINATPAPWAKDEDHTVLKAPSIREIQEMEAKQAAERQASEKKVTTTNATTTVTKEDTVPSSISWGIVVPTSSNESNSSSLSTSPVVTAPAWQSNNPPPKKTLREIQKEEEEATKRRNKFREIQQAAINNANVPNVTTTQSNMGKRYADTVLVGNVNVGPKNLQKPPTNTMNNAWTTVASKSSRAVTTNISTTNVGTVGSGVIKPGGVSKDSPNVWDNDHKSINGLQNSSRSQNQSNKVSEAQKSSARGVNTGISKPVTTNSTVKSNNNSASGNSSEYSAPKPPSEEFLKWCRHALRGLNNVNVDEFLQMLLSFPLDPPPATIEIIQDSIYANSPTLDGRRFADEFIKRRKADANGLPMSFSHADNKLNKDLTTGNNSKEDYTGNGAGAFKVVTAKKNKKKQIN